MRRVYLDLAMRRLARGDLGFFLRAGASLAGLRAGNPRPLLATLVVTYRCDLRCAMCDLPSRGDRRRELSTRGLLRILDELAALGTLGVGITGGEPLLRADLEAVIRHGARRGLLTHLNTNGTLVTPERARSLFAAGLDSVNLSLDGPDAETHDRLRGAKGSFERVLRAAARFCALPGARTRVALTCALGGANAGRARALLERARDLGVDRVGFLPVHTFPEAAVAPVEEAQAARGLADRARHDPLIENSPEYLALFEGAWRAEPRPIACLAPKSSLVVDCYGSVFPCVPLHAAGRAVGRGGLGRLWRSNRYDRARHALENCRACHWNCHTELDLVLGRLGVRP